MLGQILRCTAGTWTRISSDVAVDRISTSNVAGGASLAAVVADQGTISFTLAGTAGRAYLHSTLGLVAPGVSTTGPISTTSLVWLALQAHWPSMPEPVPQSIGRKVTYNTPVRPAVHLRSVIWSMRHVHARNQNASAGTCLFTHDGLTFRGMTNYGATSGDTQYSFFQRIGTVVYVTAVRSML